MAERPSRSQGCWQVVRSGKQHNAACRAGGGWLAAFGALEHQSRHSADGSHSVDLLCQTDKCCVSAPDKTCRLGAIWERQQRPRRRDVGPSPERGADGSNLSVLGKGKCILHIDPEVADRVLDLAMAKQDLDGT